MLICVFCFFQSGIFLDVKTFHDPEWKLLSVSISGISIFSLKIGDTILNPGLTHL